ncbi:hypothetical protein BV25DRAFT_1812115, partial [Artomyces pyxidatus]
MAKGPSLRPVVEGDESFLKALKSGYKEDTLFSKIIEKPDEHEQFKLVEGIIYSKNRQGDDVVCVPSSIHKKRRLTEIVIDHAHTVVGHFGAQKTAEYIRRFYWW